MSHGEESARWPRFTMRKLAWIVTLISVYFGAWQITQTWGLVDAWPKLDERYPFRIYAHDANSPMPFVIAANGYLSEETGIRKYYFVWAFRKDLQTSL